MHLIEHLEERLIRSIQHQAGIFPSNAQNGKLSVLLLLIQLLSLVLFLVMDLLHPTLLRSTTQSAHGLNAGTPVKIKGINVSDYNISTKVVSVISERKFTYSLPSVRANLPAGPGAGLAPGANATAIIETDTVSGASPYIFNCSLRSVYRSYRVCMLMVPRRMVSAQWLLHSLPLFLSKKTIVLLLSITHQIEDGVVLDMD